MAVIDGIRIEASLDGNLLRSLTRVRDVLEKSTKISSRFKESLGAKIGLGGLSRSLGSVRDNLEKSTRVSSVFRDNFKDNSGFLDLKKSLKESGDLLGRQGKGARGLGRVLSRRVFSGAKKNTKEFKGHVRLTENVVDKNRRLSRVLGGQNKILRENTREVKAQGRLGRLGSSVKRVGGRLGKVGAIGGAAMGLGAVLGNYGNVVREDLGRVFDEARLRSLSGLRSKDKAKDFTGLDTLRGAADFKQVTGLHSSFIKNNLGRLNDLFVKLNIPTFSEGISKLLSGNFNFDGLRARDRVLLQSESKHLGNTFTASGAFDRMMQVLGSYKGLRRDPDLQVSRDVQSEFESQDRELARGTVDKFSSSKKEREVLLKSIQSQREFSKSIESLVASLVGLVSKVMGVSEVLDIFSSGIGRASGSISSSRGGY